MSNNKFADKMANRSPLGNRGGREAVVPADMYGQPQTDKPTNPQDDKGTNGQAATPDNGVIATKPTKPQVEKYTTHLRRETIKAVKRAALDRDRKDYEIVQAALDAYLQAQ